MSKKLTRDQMKQILKSRGVKFSSGASRSQLLELYANNDKIHLGNPDKLFWANLPREEAQPIPEKILKKNSRQAKSCEQIVNATARKLIMNPKTKSVNYTKKLLTTSKDRMSRNLAKLARRKVKLWKRKASKPKKVSNKRSSNRSSEMKIPIIEKLAHVEILQEEPRYESQVLSIPNSENLKSIPKTKKPKKENVEEDDVKFHSDQLYVQNAIDDMFNIASAEFSKIDDPSEQDINEYIEFVRDEVEDIIVRTKMFPGKMYLTQLAIDLFKENGYMALLSNPNMEELKFLKRLMSGLNTFSKMEKRSDQDINKYISSLRSAVATIVEKMKMFPKNVFFIPLMIDLFYNNGYIPSRLNLLLLKTIKPEDDINFLSNIIGFFPKLDDITDEDVDDFLKLARPEVQNMIRIMKQHPDRFFLIQLILDIFKNDKPQMEEMDEDLKARRDLITLSEIYDMSNVNQFVEDFVRIYKRVELEQFAESKFNDGKSPQQLEFYNRVFESLRTSESPKVFLSNLKFLLSEYSNVITQDNIDMDSILLEAEFRRKWELEFGPELWN